MKQKNPLAVAFGIILKRLRQSHDINANAIADQLGMGRSGYRLVEAGSALLRPVHSLPLAHIYTDLEWGRVALLLVIMEILDRESDTGVLRTLIESIKTVDPWFARVLDYLSPIWMGSVKAEYEENPAKFIESTDVTCVLESYLSQPLTEPMDTGVLERAAYKIRSMLKETSPFYFDMFAGQMRQLRHFPPFVAPGKLANWENVISRRISRIYGIVTHHELLIESAEVFSGYDWDYIWRPNFEGLFILIKDPSDFVFESLLSKLVEKAAGRGSSSVNEVELREKLANKLFIKRFPEGVYGNLLDQLLIPQELTPDLTNNLGTDATWRYKNIWCYFLADTNAVVAFADNATVDTAEAYLSSMLSWTAVDKTLEVIEGALGGEIENRGFHLIGDLGGAEE